MSKEVLVGLCGPAGCGKDTVAAMLVRHGAFSKYTLAMPLKMGLEAMLDIPLSTWDDRARKEEPLPWLGKSPRQLAQTLGTEWGRQCVHPEIWVLLMKRHWEEVRKATCPRMVVTDVRFDNEAKAIIESGGTVWRVDRENVPSVAEHSSEAGISPLLLTGTVKNYGTIDQLDYNVNQWMKLLIERFSR